MLAMALSILLAAAAAAAAPSPPPPPTTTTGLTAQIYNNTVMRGEPLCTVVVPNGVRSIGCGPAAGHLVPGQY
eukprot:SAG22_NODE_12296_length_448_cov_0.891117_1_plen_72_part_10